MFVLQRKRRWYHATASTSLIKRFTPTNLTCKLINTVQAHLMLWDARGKEIMLWMTKCFLNNFGYIVFLLSNQFIIGAVFKMPDYLRWFPPTLIYKAEIRHIYSLHNGDICNVTAAQRAEVTVTDDSTYIFCSFNNENNTLSNILPGFTI